MILFPVFYIFGYKYKNMNKLVVFLLVLAPFLKNECLAQHSVAREWNEVILEGIRNDYARPTVHARNLFHFSAMMYDSWAVFDETGETYFLGKEIDGFVSSFEGIDTPADKQYASETVLSYACYRLINHRFKDSPGSEYILDLADSLLNGLGYDKDFLSEDYNTSDYAALGN